MKYCLRVIVAGAICLFVAGCVTPNQPSTFISPSLTDVDRHTAGHGVIVYDVEIFTSLRYQRHLKYPPVQRWVRDDLSLGFSGGYHKAGGHLMDPDADAGKGRRKGTFVYSLPAGRYHLVHSDFAGVTFWRGKPDARTEITIDVKADEVRYIGTLSYKFDISPGAFSIKIKDRFDRISSLVESQLGKLGPIRTALARYEPTNLRRAEKDRQAMKRKQP